ncbi:MAG: NMD3-related protein [Promethearchaeota archaeon]
MQNFCYKCGKLANEKNHLIENLCQQCYIQLHPLLKFPQPLQLKLCRKCSRYFLKNQWISSPFNKLEDILELAINETIPHQLVIHPNTELIISTNISENLESILRTNSIIIDIQGKGNVHKSLTPYIENYTAQKITLVFSICPSCLSLKRGEYQAVLHITAPGRQLTEQERDFILSFMDNQISKSIKIDHLAYISKFTMKKGKITFYIGSEKFARSLASNIKYQLGGISLRETYKFGSRRIPKEVKQNKLYISIHLPSFIKGDLILVKNSPLYVTKVYGKKVSCINLNKHEKVTIPLKILKNPKILRHFNDLHSFLYFSQAQETIQLMDLQNYRIFEIPNSSKYDTLEIGKIINGFEVNGQIYLVLESN